ncbi:MAG: OmpP1/FadL family transporter [Cellvibrio sp.]|uniref:OmpP1/FadL family transporter n=1 Tax=Cellvibrio sp. TaxID=1965322 RepID=UPI00272667C3|nr:OmpP1/FadL family transporter [Cellvibrio sp.]
MSGRHYVITPFITRFIAPPTTLTSSVALLFSIALLPATVYAASFQILEQSPAHLGKAFSGTASDVSDASSVFFNPAGIIALDNPTLSLGGNAIFTQATFNNQNSNTNGVAGKTDEIGYVPNIYYVHPVSERLSFGLGINAPYGLASEYDDDWSGRYLATHSKLEVANINAVAAYAVTDNLSVGLGINYQRADVTLESQFDSTLGINPAPATDSSAQITGDDDAFAADLSLFYTPTEKTHLGLVWRQGGEFDLQGKVEFSLHSLCSPGAGFPTGAPPAPTTGTICAASLNAVAGDAEARLHLPDTITLSGSHQLTDGWWIHGDIAWTEWSNIQSVDVINSNNNLTIDTLELHYEDTMRYALGVTHNFNSPWTWRFGIAIDEAPQTDPAFVNPRIPDQDRIWFSTGFNYELSSTTSIDLAYSHIKVDRASINNTDLQTGHRVDGYFDAEVNIVGVQANFTF